MCASKLLTAASHLLRKNCRIACVLAVKALHQGVQLVQLWLGLHVLLSLSTVLLFIKALCVLYCAAVPCLHDLQV